VGRLTTDTEQVLGAVLDALARDPAAVDRLRELLDADRGPSAYTVDAFAARVGLTPKAVRNAITRGELEAVKRGGRWIISGHAVERWSESRRSQRFTRRSATRLRMPLTDALARFERGVSSAEL
jgi:excisionase family DNA binding protein